MPSTVVVSQVHLAHRTIPHDETDRAVRPPRRRWQIPCGGMHPAACWACRHLTGTSLPAARRFAPAVIGRGKGILPVILAARLPCKRLGTSLAPDDFASFQGGKSVEFGLRPKAALRALLRTPRADSHRNRANSLRETPFGRVKTPPFEAFVQRCRTLIDASTPPSTFLSGIPGAAQKMPCLPGIGRLGDILRSHEPRTRQQDRLYILGRGISR